MSSNARIDWDSLFMYIAYGMAMRSPDPSTQVGAVIVSPECTILSTGYNGWPRGIEPFKENDERWQRPEKYHWMSHAERNAIDNASRYGVSVNGCTLYTTLFPCVECAKSIIQVGIKRVVIHSQGQMRLLQMRVDDHEWTEHLEVSADLFKQTGVAVEVWGGQIPVACIGIVGKPYTPTQPLPAPQQESLFKGIGLMSPIHAEKIVP